MGDSDESASTRERGLHAERVAEAALCAAGLTIVGRNVHAGGGELDLVALENIDGVETYVFVEVRSRKDATHGHPFETIGVNKQRHLRRAAAAYLLSRDLHDRVAVRFDAVAIVGDRVDAWIRAAFE